jgi:hypothetical protein
MSYKGIRQGLATRLATIAGLHAYPEPPDGAPEIPAAIVLPVTNDDQLTLGSGLKQRSFDIWVLLGRGTLASGIDKLDGFVDSGGAESVRAAINGDLQLGGNADTVILRGAADFGEMNWGGVSYVGARIRADVYVS